MGAAPACWHYCSFDPWQLCHGRIGVYWLGACVDLTSCCAVQRTGPPRINMVAWAHFPASYLRPLPVSALPPTPHGNHPLAKPFFAAADSMAGPASPQFLCARAPLPSRMLRPLAGAPCPAPGCVKGFGRRPLMQPWHLPCACDCILPAPRKNKTVGQTGGAVLPVDRRRGRAGARAETTECMDCME